MAVLWRVTISGLMFGQMHQNVLHFQQVEGGGTDPQFQAFRIRDVWLPQIRTLHTASLNYNSIVIQNLDLPANAPTTVPINIVGSIAASSDMLPFAAMVVLLQTGRAGRRGRGRFYVGSLPTVAFTNGLLTAARISGFETMRGVLEPAFVGPGATAGMKLVVHGKGPGAEINPVVRMAARAVVGVQRRRNIGIGI